MSDELNLRTLTAKDETAFLHAMQQSITLHEPWVSAPLTAEAFQHYLQQTQQSHHQSFLICKNNEIAGVFNLNEIVRGAFQSAYLGFYAVSHFAGQGIMSLGLKMLLAKTFNELDLHRLEANIQPNNLASIYLVKNNGFRKEGFSPRYLQIGGQWRDHERWAMTVEDWKK